MAISLEKAEVLALRALAWLADDSDLCGIFLGAGGLEARDLRARAGDPELLASVLDFLLMEDRWVIAFCDAAGYGYDDLRAARAALPGGEQVHWT